MARQQKNFASRSSTIAAVWAFIFVICNFSTGFFRASAAWALPTQEEVFKSVQNSENQTVDGGKVLAVLAVAVGLGIILTLFNRREKRVAVPKALNNHGKLMKELIKTAGLKPAEARQLKVMAERKAAEGDPLDSPITLLLCPSLVKKMQPAEQ